MTNEIDQLVDSAARFLKDQAPLKRLRHSLRDPSAEGFSRDVWRRGAELGLTGLMISDRAGGLGLGAAAAGAVVEVCGRQLSPEPFLSTVCLAIPVLAAAPTALAVELLGGIATGDLVVAVAGTDSAPIGSGRSSLSATRQGTGWRLKGICPVVIEAPQSDWVLAPSVSEEEVRWFALSTADLQRVDGVLMDGRRASRLVIDVETGPAAMLASGEEGRRLTEALFVSGAALVSAWLLGVAEQATALTLQHLRTRRQFGAALGSFQALQHRMAILYCELTVARATCDAAFRAIDSGSPEAPLLASAAKARAGVAAELAGSEGIQLHGALGMTEEADIGFFYKAARVGELAAGHRFFHKHRAARLLGVQRDPGTASATHP